MFVDHRPGENFADEENRDDYTHDDDDYEHGGGDYDHRDDDCKNRDDHEDGDGDLI